MCAVAVAGEAACWGDDRYGQTDAPPGAFAEIASGARHSCGLREDKQIACWGDNSGGETDAPAGAFTKIGSGNGYSCGLRESGQVACWGSGIGQADLPRGAFADFVVGPGHSCALTDAAQMRCWGHNSHGQADAPVGDYAALALDSTASCALTVEGQVRCWGSISGQSDPAESSFVAVTLDANDPYREGHVCGLDNSGKVTCWGSNGHGQAESPSAAFELIAAGSSLTCGIIVDDDQAACWGSAYDGRTLPPEGRFDTIAADRRNACGIRRDRTLVCWGSSDYGVLDVPAGAFTQVDVGSDFACALRDTGGLACWGDSTGGVLHRPEDNFTAIAAGHDFACGILEDGRTKCWGDGGDEAQKNLLVVDPGTGRVQRGVDEDLTRAQKEFYNDRRVERAARRGDGIFPGHFVKIAVGGDILCGIMKSGRARCQSYSYRDEDVPAYEGRFSDLTSDMVPDDQGVYIDIAFLYAGSTSCTVRDNGRVACRRLRGGVELADDSNEAYVAVTMTQGTSADNSYETSVCALRTDAAVDCWGDNDAGQADVPDGSFVAVELGGWNSTSFACAIRADGALACWGNGGRDARRLPDSLRDPKSTPHKLLPPVDAAA